MTKEEVEKLYPEFEKWWREEKHYLSVGGVYLIKLWYEWLGRQAEIGTKPEPGMEEINIRRHWGLGTSSFQL